MPKHAPMKQSMLYWCLSSSILSTLEIFVPLSILNLSTYQPRTYLHKRLAKTETVPNLVRVVDKYRYKLVNNINAKSAFAKHYKCTSTKTRSVRRCDLLKVDTKLIILVHAYKTYICTDLKAILRLNFSPDHIILIGLKKFKIIILWTIDSEHFCWFVFTLQYSHTTIHRKACTCITFTEPLCQAITKQKDTKNTCAFYLEWKLIFLCYYFVN